jgi:hypothetical protein
MNQFVIKTNGKRAIATTDVSCCSLKAWKNNIDERGYASAAATAQFSSGGGERLKMCVEIIINWKKVYIGKAMMMM